MTMSDYSYELPFSNDKFLKGIIVMLKKENKYDLANLLRRTNVQIEKGGYSYYDGKWGRSDALAAYVTGRNSARRYQNKRLSNG